MTQTATGPAPANADSYLTNLHAIAGMTRTQQFLGETATIQLFNAYPDEPSAGEWTVNYPDGVDSAAVEAVVKGG